MPETLQQTTSTASTEQLWKWVAMLSALFLFCVGHVRIQPILHRLQEMLLQFVPAVPLH
jgi:hypothetical protein